MSLVEKYKPIIDNAIKAVHQRQFYAQYPEHPKAYGEDAPQKGEEAYKKQLNNKIDKLLEAGVDENSEEIIKLKKAVGELENSHEGMMNWMHQFNVNFDGMVEAEILEYLNDQMTKIKNVAKETNAALRKAEELLAK